MVVRTCLVIVRPLVIFLGWVHSCRNKISPRHKRRAVATTPSLAKRSAAAPSPATAGSGQAPSLRIGQGPSPATAGSGQVLKDGATKLGMLSFMRKQQVRTAQKTCRGYQWQPVASEGKANKDGEQGA